MAEVRHEPARRVHSESVAFAVGTFNVVLLALVLIIRAHGGGGLAGFLGGLNTAAGILLFALAWGLTWWATRRAMRGIALDPPPRWGDTLLRGAKGGGVAAGVLALLGLVAGVGLVLLSGSTADGALDRAIGLAATLLYGSVVAAVAVTVGAAVGLVVAAIDRSMLAAARCVERLDRR